MKISPAIPATETGPATHSLQADLASYLVIAFGFSWFLMVGAIKLGLGEEYLNIGVAGPSVAAIILSRNRRRSLNVSSTGRWVVFVILLIISWIVLSLHYLWWTTGAWQFHLKPLLLIPAVMPAWILSAVLSGDEGVRSFLGRLVHPPDGWSLFALFYFPVLLGIPSLIARRFGVALVWPDLGGLTWSAIANASMFFFYNLLFVATEEEPGWRGFLLDRLQTRFSPLTTSLLVWLPWAVWHAPLDYYRPVRFTLVQELLLRVVFLIPLTIILTWLYNRSGRSVQATVIFHACMNTFPFVIPYYQLAWLVVFLFAAYAVIADRMWVRLPTAYR